MEKIRKFIAFINHVEDLIGRTKLICVNDTKWFVSLSIKSCFPVNTSLIDYLYILHQFKINFSMWSHPFLLNELNIHSKLGTVG